MNLLYDAYPKSVVLCGRTLDIITDYKDWLRFYDMMRDLECSEKEKLETLLQFYLTPVPAEAVSEMHKPLIDFFVMRKAREETRNEHVESTSGKVLYDFKFDAACIISGFLQDYGIDLTRNVYMHWWKFRILLDGLSADTEFKQRVMYRNTDTGQIKDGKERQRIQKIQRAIAIPQQAPTDFETGDMFW